MPLNELLQIFCPSTPKANLGIIKGQVSNLQKRSNGFDFYIGQAGQKVSFLNTPCPFWLHNGAWVEIDIANRTLTMPVDVFQERGKEQSQSLIFSLARSRETCQHLSRAWEGKPPRLVCQHCGEGSDFIYPQTTTQ